MEIEGSPLIDRKMYVQMQQGLKKFRVFYNLHLMARSCCSYGYLVRQGPARPDKSVVLMPVISLSRQRLMLEPQATVSVWHRL